MQMRITNLQLIQGAKESSTFLLLVLSSSDVRKKRKFVPDLRHVFSPQNINRRISKRKHTMRKVFTVLLWKWNFKSVVNKRFIKLRLLVRMFVTPHGKNTTEREAVHVYSCEQHRYGRGSTVISSLGITSTSNIRIPNTFPLYFLMTKYRKLNYKDNH